MATHWGFVQKQLSYIQKAYEREHLDCVYLYSGYDDNFARLYIRWYVGIKLIHPWDWQYRMDEEYQSYQLWGKSDGYRHFREADFNAWSLTCSFSDDFDQYDRDISQFVQMMKIYFPDVKFYFFPSDFEFTTSEYQSALGRTIHNYTFHLKRFASTNIMVKTEDGFQTETVFPCKIEDIPDEHGEIQQLYRECVDAHKIFEEQSLEMRKGFAKQFV